MNSIIKGFLASQEFKMKSDEFKQKYMNNDETDLYYRCPIELQATPTPLKKVALLGQCLLEPWATALKSIAPQSECEFVLFNNVQSLPERKRNEIDGYDFQVVALPLRSVVPDASYFRLSYKDLRAYERLFSEATERLKQYLNAAMQWNARHGLLTFVTNFMAPQQNPMGRLLPRYDLRNFVYFIERLNQVLAEEVASYRNAYLFDIDQVFATYGRKFAQDDAVWTVSHGSLLGDFDFALDRGRLEKPVPATQHYRIRREQYIRYAWVELLAMYRTVRQLDSVKLVVIDLDDTLWRESRSKQPDLNYDAVEGWPVGFAEALMHLKRRGVLLAVVSKNDPSLVAPVMGKLYRNRLDFNEFAVVKINWRPKVESFGEILKEVNLLPRNVVYIDDNPVERASIKSAFPDVRTFGPNPLVWRRLLLWSPEIQVPAITAESSARTAMVQAQIERDHSREKMSRNEFLESLAVEMSMRQVDHLDHADFPRLFELLNKSNQFNTTGRRWTKQELARAMAEGVSFFVFEVRDRFTAYGIVGIMIFDRSAIIQFVMSCRVVGMDVEIAAVAELLRVMQRRFGGAMVTGILEETDLNLLARDLWRRCGFTQSDGSWVRPYEPELSSVSHVKVAVEQREPASAVL